MRNKRINQLEIQKRFRRQFKCNKIFQHCPKRNLTIIQRSDNQRRTDLNKGTKPTHNYYVPIENPPKPLACLLSCASATQCPFSVRQSVAFRYPLVDHLFTHWYHLYIFHIEPRMHSIASSPQEHFKPGERERDRDGGRERGSRWPALLWISIGLNLWPMF